METLYLEQMIRENISLVVIDSVANLIVVPAVNGGGKGKIKGKGGKGDRNRWIGGGQPEDKFLQFQALFSEKEQQAIGKGKKVRHHLLVEGPSVPMAGEGERASQDRQTHNIASSSTKEMLQGKAL